MNETFDKEKRSLLEKASADFEAKLTDSKLELEKLQSQNLEQIKIRYKMEIDQVRNESISMKEAALNRENDLAGEVAKLREELNASKNMTTVVNQKVVKLEEELVKGRRALANAEKDKENAKSALRSEMQQALKRGK